MIRMGIAGLGKMGLSHLAILNAHPNIEVVAVCDGLKYLTNNLKKFVDVSSYSDYADMLEGELLDAVLIATPSKMHADMAKLAISKGLHIFCEKPFVLSLEEGEELCAQAQQQGLVTQVGYHNRFVGTFQQARDIVSTGVLGTVHHFSTEAYGPVVVRPQSVTWRSKKSEGGGVVYDYACHALDLVNFVLGPIESVSGVIRNSIFSRDVDDEIYCSMKLESGVEGQLSANWSDESQRKMTTKISVWGTNGHIKVDRQECSIYLREPSKDGVFGKGWSTVNITELTKEVWFYLRGEEYSAQIDEFVRRIEGMKNSPACDFQIALETDRAVAMIIDPESVTTEAKEGLTSNSSFFKRAKTIFGMKHV